jgi:DNA-binding response OmpR family regulator
MDYTILIIDDNEMVHILLKKILGEEYDLSHARDAQEGINILSEKKINLVLSDIHMPGISGLEFLESLKKDADKKDVPVLIITSEPTEEKENLALDLGAVDFIDKELIHKNKEELLERVRMKLVTGLQTPDLDKKLKIDKKKIAKSLMSEAITGDFFTTSRKFFTQIATAFDIDYISFWTITGTEPNLILCIGELQPTQFGAEELKQEKTYQQLLEKREAYLSNHVFKEQEGILTEVSKGKGIPAEIGVPIFDIDEKTLLKNKFKVPKEASLFGYIVMKRQNLFSEREFKLLKKLLMQAGTILWRLYSRM